MSDGGTANFASQTAGAAASVPVTRGLTRITFNAYPTTMAALSMLTEGDCTQTEALNRAIRLAAFVHRWAQDPGGLRIVTGDGTIERIHLL